MMRLGIPLGLATDNKPPDPWLAFRAAVDRRDMASGAVLGEGERLSRLAALRALCGGGAWLQFAERDRGRLLPGWAADLCALDRDPLTMPLDAVESVRSRLTMVEGQVIHDDLGG